MIGGVLLALAATGCGESVPETPLPVDESWIDLYNGRDLTGWTAKIRGHPLGEDPYDTFRVQDGLLVVRYDRYDAFDDRFGHLFFERPFDSYLLEVEYRFVGEQAQGGEGWALRNSGVMFHAQDPATMALGQDFPISLEAQFLGGNGEDLRPTMNLCTPGTHVVMGDTLATQHCITADAPTVHGDAWVTVEIEVTPEAIVHRVGDREVLRYRAPEVGGGVVNDYLPEAKVDGTPLSAGWIALQSESHPIEFRRVRIRELSAP